MLSPLVKLDGLSGREGEVPSAEAVAHFSYGNNAVNCVIAVKGINCWAAYWMPHVVSDAMYATAPIGYQSVMAGVTARTGTKLPEDVAKTMFGSTTEEWGYYRE